MGRHTATTPHTAASAELAKAEERVRKLRAWWEALSQISGRSPEDRDAIMALERDVFDAYLEAVRDRERAEHLEHHLATAPGMR